MEIQWIPVNWPLLGPEKKWQINQNGRLTKEKERRQKFGTGENWPFNRKWMINRWPLNRNPLYYHPNTQDNNSLHARLCDVRKDWTNWESTCDIFFLHHSTICTCNEYVYISEISLNLAEFLRTCITFAAGMIPCPVMGFWTWTWTYPAFEAVSFTCSPFFGISGIPLILDELVW